MLNMHQSFSGRGCAPDPVEGTYDASPGLLELGRGTPPLHFPPLDAFARSGRLLFYPLPVQIPGYAIDYTLNSTHPLLKNSGAPLGGCD